MVVDSSVKENIISEIIHENLVQGKYGISDWVGKYIIQ